MVDKICFPEYACQKCGSVRKLVETIIDDEFAWNDAENQYEPVKYTEDFEHTGVERCAECGDDWSGYLEEG